MKSRVVWLGKLVFVDWGEMFLVVVIGFWYGFMMLVVGENGVRRIFFLLRFVF